MNYESYFLGIQKREPYSDRQELERTLRKLLGRQFTNTAHKFKFRQLCAKYNTYKQYWNRIIRKIEEGTYERDQFLLAHKDKFKTTAKNGDLTRDDKAEVDRYKQEVGVKDLYNSLLESKKKCKESTDSLYYSDFKNMIDKQTKQIKEKFKCKSVDFKIVTDNGKTRLKAFPKKK